MVPQLSLRALLMMSAAALRVPLVTWTDILEAVTAASITFAAMLLVLLTRQQKNERNTCEAKQGTDQIGGLQTDEIAHKAHEHHNC